MSRAIGVFAGLPAAFRELVPELDALDWAEESRATCERCAMVPETCGEPASSPWAFHPGTRCCTYFPMLANFLAGRALREGGVAAGLVMQRIVEGAGITALAIAPTEAWVTLYRQAMAERFGRDPSLLCPYWVGGERACGLWAHRSATCRTWFCKHDQGLGGAVEWSQVKQVLARAETLLARFCVDRGEPPGQGAAVQAWRDWYLWCAGRVDEAGGDEIRALADEVLIEQRSDLVQIKRIRPRVPPDVVVPAVSEMWPEARGVRISGYSHYDTVLAPGSIFAFLSRLDGVRTWRQALAGASAAGAVIDEVVVHELYRVGAIEAPGAVDATVIRREPWPGLAEDS
jgi:hypothetical protein